MSSRKAPQFGHSGSGVLCIRSFSLARSGSKGEVIAFFDGRYNFLNFLPQYGQERTEGPISFPQPGQRKRLPSNSDPHRGQDPSSPRRYMSHSGHLALLIPVDRSLRLNIVRPFRYAKTRRNTAIAPKAAVSPHHQLGSPRISASHHLAGGLISMAP